MQSLFSEPCTLSLSGVYSLNCHSVEGSSARSHKAPLDSSRDVQIFEEEKEREKSLKKATEKSLAELATL